MTPTTPHPIASQGPAAPPDAIDDGLVGIADIRAAAAQYLPLDKRVELIVEPEKKP